MGCGRLGPCAAPLPLPPAPEEESSTGGLRRRPFFVRLILEQVVMIPWDSLRRKCSGMIFVLLRILHQQLLLSSGMFCVLLSFLGLFFIKAE